MSNTNKQDDYELIRRINEGDTTAFRQLVYLYKDVSLSLACSILKDKTRAEDVLQDVFVKVYTKLNTFKFKASFSTWLYRIVVNTSYNELKKQKHTVTIDTIAITLDTEGKDLTLKSDQKMYINLALEKLRPDKALILRLFYLCESSIKEIEDITGFTQSKIKVNLHRGRENMHFQLKQILGNDLKNLL